MRSPRDLSSVELLANLSVQLLDLFLLNQDIAEFARFHKLDPWKLCSPSPSFTEELRRQIDNYVDEWNWRTFQIVAAVEELALRSSGGGELSLLRVFGMLLLRSGSYFSERCTVESVLAASSRWKASQPYLVLVQAASSLLADSVLGAASLATLTGYQRDLWVLLTISGAPGIIGSASTVVSDWLKWSPSQGLLKLLGVAANRRDDALAHLVVQIAGLTIISQDASRLAADLNLNDSWSLCSTQPTSETDRQRKDSVIAEWDKCAAQVVESIARVVSLADTKMKSFVDFCKQHLSLFRRCFVEDLLRAARNLDATRRVLVLLLKEGVRLRGGGTPYPFWVRGLLVVWHILTGSAAIDDALRTYVTPSKSYSSRWLLRQLGADAVGIPRMSLQDFGRTLKQAG